MSDNEVRRSDTAESDEEENSELNRSVLLLVAAGLFPAAVWLWIHLFFPELLMIDITPGAAGNSLMGPSDSEGSGIQKCTSDLSIMEHSSVRDSESICDGRTIPFR